MFHILNQGPFPCHSCKAECCGPIPFWRNDWKRALKLLAAKGMDNIERLSQQRRDASHCMFVDTQNYTCSIYESRPVLCQVFGSHPLGVCHYVPEESLSLSQEAADRQMLASGTASMGVVEGISGRSDRGELLGLSLKVLDWDFLKQEIKRHLPPRLNANQNTDPPRTS